MEKTLSGIRVLDFTDAMAGPYCTTQLAACGCEVINIERPGGKVIRSVPPFQNGYSIDFIYNHCGKKSLSMDLKNPEARDLTLKMAGACDVVVENYRPGVMAGFGLDYEAFKKANPSIVMCSISAWGQTGPYAELMGVDVITQAQAGIAYMSSDPGDRPHFVGFPVTDILAGVTAFGAICSALYRRRQTGQGDYIDIAMYECLICALYNSVGTHVMTKGEREYRYMGTFSPDFSPCGAYKGRDGYLAIFGRTDVAWERITELMGKPELNKDARYDSLANRVKNNKEVTTIVEEWLQTFEKVSDAAALLQSQRVMAGPVNSVGRVIDEDPQWQAREMMHGMEHPVFGPMRFLNSPLHFRNAKSGTETTAAVKPGEHTTPVLRELLNLSDEKIETLRQRQIVFDESRES